MSAGTKFVVLWIGGLAFTACSAIVNGAAPELASDRFLFLVFFWGLCSWLVARFGGYNDG